MGRASIADFVKGFDAMAKDMKLASWDITDSKVQWVDPTTAVHSYKWTGTGTYQGQPIPSPVWASTVWTMKNGKWSACSTTSRWRCQRQRSSGSGRRTLSDVRLAALRDHGSCQGDHSVTIQSSRRAASGSIRPARRAGRYPAATARSAIPAAAADTTAAFVLATPNRKLRYIVVDTVPSRLSAPARFAMRRSCPSDSSTRSCIVLYVEYRQGGDRLDGQRDDTVVVLEAAGRRPNSLRIDSSTGSIMPARFARMTRSHSGSNFFQPAA